MKRKYQALGNGEIKKFSKGKYTYYRYRCTINGEKMEFVGKSEKEVESKLDDFLKKPLNRSQRETLKMSFSDYAIECSRYFAELSRLDRPKQAHVDITIRLSRSKLGKTPLGEVTSIDISNYMKYYNEEKLYTKRTINGDLSYIRRCLRKACEDGLLDFNPSTLVTPLQEKEMVKHSKKVASLQLSDMEKLKKEAYRLNTIENPINGKPGTRVYGVNAQVICMLLYNGLRIGECLALTWGNIECNTKGEKTIHITHSFKEVKGDDGKYTLVRGYTKTDRSNRYITINKSTQELLDEIRELHPNASDDDLIFVSEEGTPILKRNVNRTLKQMLIRANCSNTKATCHSLRHTYGSALIAKGAHIEDVSKLLGHSDERITSQIYVDLLDDNNSRTSRLIDEIFE